MSPPDLSHQERLPVISARVRAVVFGGAVALLGGTTLIAGAAPALAQLAPVNAGAVVDGVTLTFGSTAPAVNLGSAPTLGAPLPATTHRFVSAHADLDGNTDLRWAYLYMNASTDVEPDAEPGYVLAAYDLQNHAFFLGDLSCLQATGADCWTLVPAGTAIPSLEGVVLHGNGAYATAGSTLLTDSDVRPYLAELLARTGSTYTGAMAAEVTWLVDFPADWRESPSVISLATVDAAALVPGDYALTGFAAIESLGWMDLSTVVVSGSVLQGVAATESSGWVSFQSGAPAGCTPQSAADYGVLVQPGNTLCGFAWSETLGWVSFNEAGVTATLDPAAHTLSGYAALESGGFIEFGH